MTPDEKVADLSKWQRAGGTAFRLSNWRGHKRLGHAVKPLLFLLLICQACTPVEQVSTQSVAAQEYSDEFDREMEDIFAQLRTKPGDRELQERVLALIEGALRANPGAPEILDARCHVMAHWRTSEAVAACSEAVSAERDPNDEIFGTPSQALANRGYAYLCVGEPEKALHDFYAWSELPLPPWALAMSYFGGAHNPLPWYFRGVANRQVGNELLARVDLEEARVRNRDEPVQIVNEPDEETGFPLFPQCVADLLQEMDLMGGPATADQQSSELVSAYNRASQLAELGQYAGALFFAERALALGEQEFGPDNPSTATLLNKVADLYLDQGKYLEAEPLIARALAIQERNLGPDHTDVADSLYIFSRLYSAQGKYAEAESALVRALAIWEKAVGPEHSKVARNLNTLAEHYRHRAKYADAEPLYARSLAIAEKVHGPEDNRVGLVLNGLAELYRAQGRYAEAEPLYKRALAIWKETVGPEHPFVVMNMENYAALLHETGRSAEAAKMEARAKDIRARHEGGL